MTVPLLPSRLLDESLRTVNVTQGQDAYGITRRALESIALSKASGARVLLKPNAGRLAAPASGIDTHPEVVAAAVDAFIEAGADVSVGDSPIAGVRSLEALEMCGIAEVVRQRSARLLDLDQRQPAIIDLPEGIAIRKLKVCADVLEHDLVVSNPVMKTHMHTGVTL